MSVGRALHIGVNFVDPGHYGNWFGSLKGCNNDANDMAAITKAQSFQVVTTLLGASAKRQAVIDKIKDAAGDLRSGGIFVLTFAGHGFQVPDLNGDEEDGRDEVWALFDRGLVDDEIHGLLAMFRPGVRIFLISDSCNSGTVIGLPATRMLITAREALGGDDDAGPRVLPDEIARLTFEFNLKYYSGIQKEFPEGKRIALDASVISISACQDNQVAADGKTNGLFTEKLKEVWANGSFVGSYRDFHSLILNKMPYSQSPKYLFSGAANPQFERSKPFII